MVEKDNFTITIWFGVIMAVIGYLIPILGLVAVLIVIILALFLLFRWQLMTFRHRIIVIALLSLMIIRIACFVVGLTIAYSTPPPRDISELYKRLGFLGIGCMPDPGLFETQLCYRRDETRDLLRQLSSEQEIVKYLQSQPGTSGGIPGTQDIYTQGETLRWFTANSNRYIYSVGPDEVDDQGRIVYDPTNGLSSRGDLMVMVEHGQSR